MTFESQAASGPPERPGEQKRLREGPFRQNSDLQHDPDKKLLGRRMHESFARFSFGPNM